MINISLSNKEQESQSQKDIKEDIKYERESIDNKNEYINNQVQLIWKKFLDSNPDIFKKLSSLLDKDNNNALTVGSVMIANGMYEEAKLWKEYRTKELSKLNIDIKEDND